MRKVRDDDGAVAIVVALLAVVLFGFGALVIDVGALYEERRQLQNGADLSALSIAQSCAAGSCGAFAADAETYADGNASDAVSRIPANGVCGTTSVGLPSCVNPPSGLVGSGYVRVDTRTETSSGSSLVPPFLSKVLDPTYDGTEVGAQATVIWGAPRAVNADLAITFSQCEYARLTQDSSGNTVYAEAPFNPSLERIIYFHDTTEAGSCPAGPSGADLPGGFGWLDATSGCTATITNGWAGDQTGAAASRDCKAALRSLLGKTVLIPVYDAVNGLSGTNGEYRIWSYVGFVLTGWNFPGTQQSSSTLTVRPNPCRSSQTCLSGYFVEVVAPAAGPVSNGPDQGVRVVQLIS